ncbi:MAG: peptidoglycan editing factor PgeF [Candidatus Riflebacteria bacterium]|nr:peptidoglycan editing factor PgeF [Candidatus Riflebacteria bacterium]
MAFSMITSRGVTYLASELLDQVQGVRHGFATRVGGVSPEPWNTLNLGFKTDDEEARVHTNWGRFLGALGLAGRPLMHLTQVHSNRALFVSRTPDSGIVDAGEGDALYTNQPGFALATVAADCVPVLVAAGAPAKAVAAIHAGWRGIAAGIVVNTIQRLASVAGMDLSHREFTVAVGPHIKSCCFEVGPEVVDRFHEALQLEPSDLRPGERDRCYLDLQAVLIRQLASCGVHPDRVDVVRHCTRCRPDLFFSYRRDGPCCGMLGAAVCLES